jgi:alkaline phosphatase D
MPNTHSANSPHTRVLRATRRQLLHFAAASAASLGLTGHAWSQPRFDSDPFKLGVASGSPTHDSVVLWTRLLQTSFFGGNQLSGQSIPVRWEMAHDAQFTSLVQSGPGAVAGPIPATSQPGLEPDMPANAVRHARFQSWNRDRAVTVE